MRCGWDCSITRRSVASSMLVILRSNGSRWTASGSSESLVWCVIMPVPRARSRNISTSSLLGATRRTTDSLSPEIESAGREPVAARPRPARILAMNTSRVVASFGMVTSAPFTPPLPEAAGRRRREVAGPCPAGEGAGELRQPLARPNQTSAAKGRSIEAWVHEQPRPRLHCEPRPAMLDPALHELLAQPDEMSRDIDLHRARIEARAAQRTRVRQVRVVRDAPQLR